MPRKEKSSKNRGKENKAREERKELITTLVNKYGGINGKGDKVDMEELRMILTDLDKGTPPLPRDLLWCMEMGDQDGSGELSKGELSVVLLKFDSYKEHAAGILQLIAKYDKDKDLQLSNDEMLGLLREATGSDDVGEKDVAAVNKKFHKYSKGSKGRKASIDSDALAKAISLWDSEQHRAEGMFAFGDRNASSRQKCFTSGITSGNETAAPFESPFSDFKMPESPFGDFKMPDSPFKDFKMPDFQAPDHSKTFEDVGSLFSLDWACCTGLDSEDGKGGRHERGNHGVWSA
mmetsp:Transcript_33582/g.79493  ORF Transcript_33582/g.79493 Transcript_33582/m.79493 type:complete len:291 (+) Transcript_33582:122-994(+)